MTRREPYAYRSDAGVTAFDDTLPIIIFDGKCVLCSGFAAFVMKQDHHMKLRLLTAQTSLGEALYRHFDLRYGDFDTYVLLESGSIRVKSDAALRIFALLGWPWAVLSVGYVLPRLLRDAIYDFVARHRVAWFGARESCYAPDAAEAGRFVQ
ncbi:MAG: DCC1-like thiol-disulfide oxidoreductase family protein [Hyphomonadaceae bacterium]